jgi:hypothetical protein
MATIIVVAIILSLVLGSGAYILLMNKQWHAQNAPLPPTPRRE